MTQETLEPPDAVRYREAGVDIDAGEALVRAIAPLARSTARPGASAEIGGFGGLFDLKQAGFRDPILVAATDGVGTKLQLLAQSGRHRVAGIDLVAMCVNDLVVQGAEPLFFLDYYATAKLVPEQAARGDRGDRRGLPRGALRADRRRERRDAGPLQAGRLRPRGLRGRRGRAGLAPAADRHRAPATSSSASPPAASTPTASPWSARSCATVQLDLPDPAPFAPGESLASALLVPTRIYARSLLSLLGHTDVVKAMAHITGGGLIDNLPRVLPDGVVARIDASSWRAPPVFLWLYEAGRLRPEEMLRTFNCGIGMVLVVVADYADATITWLSERGETVSYLGELIPGEGPARVRIDGMDA